MSDGILDGIQNAAPQPGIGLEPEPVTMDLGPDGEGLAQPEGIELDFSFIKRATGEGDLDQYKNHMFNPRKNEGMAHILRGLTGIIGTDLNFAIADIMVGIFKLTNGRSRKPAEVPANE